MSKGIFDYDEGDYAYTISDDTAINSKGNILLRMGRGMAMNMDTGDIHIVSDWSNDDDD